MLIGVRAMRNPFAGIILVRSVDNLAVTRRGDESAPFATLVRYPKLLSASLTPEGRPSSLAVSSGSLGHATDPARSALCSLAASRRRDTASHPLGTHA